MRSACSALAHTALGMTADEGPATGADGRGTLDAQGRAGGAHAFVRRCQGCEARTRRKQPPEEDLPRGSLKAAGKFDAAVISLQSGEVVPMLSS